jgi:hypothetical protein
MDFRGIIANAVIASNGRCQGTLVSPDNNAGEEGRHTLTQGGPIDTSPVITIDVIEGQLVLKTMNSQYLIEGSVRLSSTLRFEGYTTESYNAEQDTAQQEASVSNSVDGGIADYE